MDPINYDKHDYQNIESFSNVVLEVAKGSPPVDMVIHSALSGVVRHVALRHPDWTLVGRDTYERNGYYHVSDFHFFAGRDYLGRVSKAGYRSYDAKIEVNNHRIGATRVKRGGMQTCDPKKAIKAIEKFFGVRNADELAEISRKEARSVIGNATWRTGGPFDDIMKKLAPAMATYIITHYDQMAPALVELGAPPQALSLLADVFEAHKAAGNVSRTGRTRTVIVATQGRYLVTEEYGFKYEMKCSEELSADVRGKLGMLKLTDVNPSGHDFIPDVGVRISENVFCIVE